MTGLIDVGGGLRGAYGSGVLDRCADAGISFDVLIGVSAGSANVATFAAGQRGRTLRFYRDYTFRSDYMSFFNVLKGKHFLDLDYVYSELSNEGKEDPFGFDGFFNYPGKVCAVATNAKTGEPVYFENKDFLRNDLRVLKASSCLPLVCGVYEVNGIPCMDGGVADPVPLQRAFAMGCDRVVVILTMPKDEKKKKGIDGIAAALLKKHYPAVAKKVAERSEIYNRALADVREREKAGDVLVVAPDNTCGMKTLTKDKQKILALYEKGYRDGGAIAPFVKDILKKGEE